MPPNAEPDHVPLPADKHLALDAVHFTAEEHSLDIDLQPGDLEFFSNLTLFHARTSSTDSEEHSCVSSPPYLLLVACAS